MRAKPKRCCHPDCFNCPYKDCRYDGMETVDYTETNQRDYDLYEDSTGRKYHKGNDSDYRIARQQAYNRENPKPRDRKEYLKQYYKDHKQEILEKQKEKYDTAENTRKCRKWRIKNINKRREYDHQRYLRRKEAGEFDKHRKETV